MIASKQQFFALKPSTPTVYLVPIGTETAYVREMSAHERTQFDLSNDSAKNPTAMQSLRERLVILATCDEAGKPLFDETDLAAVGSMPVSLVEPIFEKIREVNGFVTKAVTDIAKNSEKTT